MTVKNVPYFYSNFLQCGAQKNTSVLSNCPLLRLCLPPLSETLCFGTCLFNARLLNTHSALIGSALTRLSQHHSPCLSQRSRVFSLLLASEVGRQKCSDGI